MLGGSLSEQALSGQDYVTTQRTVDIPTGVTRVPVEIPILAVSNLAQWNPSIEAGIVLTKT